jgi:MFS family permease
MTATTSLSDKILDLDAKAEAQHTEAPETDNAAAMEMERIEHDMGLWDSLRNYRGAVFWSLAVSMCIVSPPAPALTQIMEGYDLALVGNLIALGAFRERFGVYVDERQGYQVSAAWQSAVTQAPTIGAFFGVLIAAYMASRLGYRWTLQIFMVMMTASIFVVFFSSSLPVLFVGQFLSGVPWGAFSVIPTAYASEVAPVRLRVVLTSYIQICWCIGQFVTAGVVYGVKDMEGQWAYRIPFALQWVWPAFLVRAQPGMADDSTSCSSSPPNRRGGSFATARSQKLPRWSNAWARCPASTASSTWPCWCGRPRSRRALLPAPRTRSASRAPLCGVLCTRA